MASQDELLRETVCGGVSYPWETAEEQNERRNVGKRLLPKCPPNEWEADLWLCESILDVNVIPVLFLCSNKNAAAVGNLLNFHVARMIKAYVFVSLWLLDRMEEF